MSKITCKFGGTSLADAESMRRVQAIVLANPGRRYIVPSAPGKRTPDDMKVTDLLYTWHNLAHQGLDPGEMRGMIETRFTEMARELGVELDVRAEMERMSAEDREYDTPDYMASRGEYLNGMLLARLLDATFVDPAGHILFDDEGYLDPASYDRLGQVLKGGERFVIPGFYGSTPGGKVKTFSRGGSDITGAVVARATHSDLYENWTDVSGFRMADPRIVKDPRRIEELTYQELRELSYMGAQVLHDEAIYPVREPGIPIHICNTMKPDEPGTLIVADREPSQPVVGIAGRAGFTMINIEKTLMNKERGFGRKVLSVLEEHQIRWEHMPTGIDTISLIVRDEELGVHGPSVKKGIENQCQPDRVNVITGLAMIATVGRGMVHHVGTAARLCTALANAGVNIRVIDQGSSEMNIIIGVEEQDLGPAVRAIYEEFAKD